MALHRDVELARHIRMGRPPTGFNKKLHDRWYSKRRRDLIRAGLPPIVESSRHTAQRRVDLIAHMLHVDA